MIILFHPLITLIKIISFFISLHYIKYSKFFLFISVFICINLFYEIKKIINNYNEFALYYLLQTLFPWIVIFDKFKFCDIYLKVVYSENKDIILKDDIISLILDYEENIKKEYESYLFEINQIENEIKRQKKVLKDLNNLDDNLSFINKTINILECDLNSVKSKIKKIDIFINSLKQNNDVFNKIYSLHNNHVIHNLKQSENTKITKIINNLSKNDFLLDKKVKDDIKENRFKKYILAAKYCDI